MLTLTILAHCRTNKSTTLKARYYSLDVFRGATVAFMILVNSPGSWAHIFSPLGHAKWHGLTPTDLVFPFFLFAVGNAMAFVMPRLEVAGPAAFWRKVAKRTALIFGIGLLLNWYPFVHWVEGALVAKGWTWTKGDGTTGGVRILGVLQRIALCYFFGSILVYYFKARGAFLAGLIILLLYWAFCIAGNPADPYSLEGWFGTAIDKAILGEPHLYRGEGVAFDPEGLVSTLPAIVQVIFGYLVGDYLRRRNLYLQEAGAKTESSQHLYQTIAVLLLSATALLFTAYAWNLSFPINKKIWTSSYVCATTGLAIAVLATLVYFIEIRKATGGWSRFFDVFGKNPLFIYALSGLIPKTLSVIRIPDGTDVSGSAQYTNPWSWFYDHVCANIPGIPEIGSLVFALCFVGLLWAVGYWMDKRRIYVRV
ncbi:Predicted acyltransferase [Cnuella takakiae]|uniref:Predicted acyltransferase n=1 Tax=Cnuella takakiae TaxID=1302690 RepID=A0A1M5DQQ0_9BACT|nr:Predicted acyltransferase [Cnuella takakiae]